MKTSLCNKCGKQITNNNFKKHIVSCAPKKKKIRGIDYDPNWGYIKGTRTAWNKGLHGHPKCQRETSWMKGKTHSDETKKRLSEMAKKNGFGGYNEHSGKSKKYYMNDSFGKKVCLQSSYEFECAKLLNELNIKWIRPSYLKYGSKKYFPDFYLVEYDVYLDPKNSYLATIDQDKITKVMNENRVRIYILTKDLINKEKILSLCS